MANDGLFDTWLPALWTKQRPAGTPPMWIMHRFLASDQVFATAARELQRDLREPEIVFRVWQGLLPKERGAPRLSYPAPKKRPAAEDLVVRLMETDALRREDAEERVNLLERMGRLEETCRYYGVPVE